MVTAIEPAPPYLCSSVGKWLNLTLGGIKHNFGGEVNLLPLVFVQAKKPKLV